jgi:hypothetical protein
MATFRKGQRVRHTSGWTGVVYAYAARLDYPLGVVLDNGGALYWYEPSEFGQA